MKKFSLAIASAALATVLLALTFGGVAAAGDEGFRPAAQRLTVGASGPSAVGGLMPGDALATRTITVTASGCLDYSLTVRSAGTQALADQLQVTITVAGSGEVLYEGPLASVDAAGARSLCDASEELRIDGRLPLSAGNEVQGATLEIEWVVVATETGAAQGR